MTPCAFNNLKSEWSRNPNGQRLGQFLICNMTWKVKDPEIFYCPSSDRASDLFFDRYVTSGEEDAPGQTVGVSVANCDGIITYTLSDIEGTFLVQGQASLAETGGELLKSKHIALSRAVEELNAYLQP